MNAYIVILLVAVTTVQCVPFPAQRKIAVYEASEPTEKVQIGINGIRNAPMIALTKSKDGLLAFYLENGLVTLATSPSQRINKLNEMLKVNNENTALIFNPVTLANENAPTWQQVRDLSIARIVAPENVHVSAIAKTTLSKHPIVMFFEREDFKSRNYQQIVSLGEVDLNKQFGGAHANPAGYN